MRTPTIGIEHMQGAIREGERESAEMDRVNLAENGYGRPEAKGQSEHPKEAQWVAQILPEI